MLGNHRLFEERRLCSPAMHREVDAASAKGRTAVLVARNGEPVGVIALSDRPRESGRDALDLLRRQGIESLVMLTGDSHGTAKVIADELGVDEFRAELMPEDKVAAIVELRRRFGSVAMVGDGVNDAPALASADVGIAMGAAGSDAALETADVALMADELLKIPYAFRLSHATPGTAITATLVKAAFVGSPPPGWRRCGLPSSPTPARRSSSLQRASSSGDDGRGEPHARDADPVGRVTLIRFSTATYRRSEDAPQSQDEP